MPTGTRQDPYRAYNFKLQIQGVTEGHFTECSGLNARVRSIAYREAGTEIVRKLPGPVEYGDITLRYGLTRSAELWNWFMNVVKGKLERKNISIIMLDNDGVTTAMQWNLVDAWPSGWDGASFNAQGQEAAIESLTITFETLERA
jgi:phage tail-like protein